MGSSNTDATCEDGGTSFYSDESDVFQIVDTGLIITSPTDQDVWYRGSTYPVTWDTNSQERYASIWWKPASTPDWNLYFASAANDGQTDFTVPAEISPNTNIQIRVCIGHYFDDQGKFQPDCSKVSKSTPAFRIANHFIEITSPQSGDSIPVGNQDVIAWDYESDLSLVSLWWKAEGLNWKLIKKNHPIANNLAWKAPPTLTKSANIGICIQTRELSTEDFINPESCAVNQTG